ncbi:MAG: hypothetical protein C5B49_01220 [Bdellovibrio sp.]|nr:MAG: hypothetical protein C5B49_01220 [Bdellovibrio sp.]
MLFFKLVPVLLSAALLPACATSGGYDPTYSKFRIVLAEENFKLGRKLTSSHADFLKLTKDEYLASMRIQNSALVRELLSFDEMIFGVSPQTFVVCVRSVKDTISICDNSYTAQPDRVKPTANTDLKKLMDEIRGP